MKIHKSKYTHSSKLYVKNDPDQLPRHCVGVLFTPAGTLYELKHPHHQSDFYYEFEVNSAEDIEVKLGLN